MYIKISKPIQSYQIYFTTHPPNLNWGNNFYNEKNLQVWTYINTVPMYIFIFVSAKQITINITHSNLDLLQVSLSSSYSIGPL
jgi:hypothetical protein